ncbi:MAG: hypothetical protein Q7U44_09440 [Desulfuromonadales bacterium]|nr:hypothetical protein [Desulfuromonadales bacterium]
MRHCPQNHRRTAAKSARTPRLENYAQHFDEGIRKLRTTGKLQQILARYNLSDWKK